MTHLSIDIETLGTKPGSIILSVGITAFDPTDQNSQDALIENGSEFFLDIEGQKRLGLEEDEATIEWWGKQSAVARQHQFDEKHRRLTLTQLYTEISSIIVNEVAQCVWANGPAFDMVLLEHAFRAAALPCPWKYSAGRDIRTLGELTGLRPVVQGIAHNALHDAAAQAQFVQQCYAALKIRA